MRKQQGNVVKHNEEDLFFCCMLYNKERAERQEKSGCDRFRSRGEQWTCDSTNCVYKNNF